jgi:hypothetical protein
VARATIVTIGMTAIGILMIDIPATSILTAGIPTPGIPMTGIPSEQYPMTLPEMIGAVIFGRGLPVRYVETWLGRDVARVTYRDVDRNGYPELVTWYDRRGNLMQQWIDRDRDGRADRVSVYRAGRVVRVIRLDRSASVRQELATDHLCVARGRAARDAITRTRGPRATGSFAAWHWTAPRSRTM